MDSETKIKHLSEAILRRLLLLRDWTPEEVQQHALEVRERATLMHGGVHYVRVGPLGRLYGASSNRKKSYRQEKERLFGHRKLAPCKYCGDMLTMNEATVDHVKPLSAGGYNKNSNYVLACHRCNSRKGSMPAQDFYKSLVKPEAKK